jgi:hypothetical protein
MESKSRTGSILAIVGGVGLAIGAFLDWGTVTLNVAKLATALGVDPSLFPAGSIPGVSQSVSGTDGWEGKVAVVAGIAAIVVGVIAMRETRKGLGVLLLVAGIIGGGVALYDVLTVNSQKDAAIEDAAPDLAGSGLQTSQLSEAIEVSLDAGIWICIIAGIVVVAGGLMVRSGEAEGAASTSPGMGSGFAMGPPSTAPMPPSTTPPAAPPIATPPAAPPIATPPTAPPMDPSPAPPTEPGDAPPNDGGTGGTA